VARSDPLGEWLEPHALAAWGPLLALVGDKQRAVQLAKEAIDAARGLPAPPVLAMTLARAADAAVLADMGTQRWLAEALETTALVLAERDPDRAATILHASDNLREAAGESRGGVRVITERARQTRDRLITAVSAEHFARHENRSRELSPKKAATLALAGLTVSS
jgi:hypothetical protein